MGICSFSFLGNASLMLAVSSFIACALGEGKYKGKGREKAGVESDEYFRFHANICVCVFSVSKF